MDEILFKTEDDITDEWLTYIENEARSLAQREDFNIDNYLDREIFNPTVKTFLTDNSEIENIIDLKSDSPLSLNLEEQIKLSSINLPIRLNFRKLRRKVKKVVCDVLTNIDDLSGKSMKEIIQMVLTALIPVIIGGIPAILLPFIIGLIAKIMKRGIDAVCGN
ncbi:MAG: hypothetical protein NXI08_04730 [bacterium]|jgi:hypothetical protein|nr:hypothetical protein [bacterium]